jgi:gamma-glutamyltranspeptidase/glutathione hydrolase
MVAMAATIAVVYPHMNGIGGDGFWLVREPSGRIRAIMAAGAAGERARPALYHGAGYDTIPPRGPLAALTVPGAVAGWMVALDGARSLGGRMPLRDLLGDAMRHAGEGCAVSRSFANCVEAVAGELAAVPGFAPTFLVDGKPPGQGQLMVLPALAATLEQLAHAGLNDFYRGDIGRELAAELERIGSPVTRTDLARCQARIAEPLSVKLSVGTAYNTAPPTQGLASLMILGMFDRLDVKEAEGVDHVHGLVEATKRALRVRDRYVTDPLRLDHAPDRYLGDAFLGAEAAGIDRKRAARWTSAADRGDTIWMGAADAKGLVVSYIQSLYWEFGSGVVLPRTGVLMQNRGVGFSLDRGTLNVLEPGRLPPHTLNPAMAVLRDGRVMAYGTMGGDAQPQFQAALFTRHVHFGQPLAVALDRPRWAVGRTWGASHGILRVEDRFDGHVLDRLASAGHEIDMIGGYSEAMGHAGAVVFSPGGGLEGAHDPRADGGAAGA